MYNPINPKNQIHPSIQALALLGPRAMQVIDRHKSIATIAAYERSLGPKVGRFMEVRSELKDLVAANKTLAGQSDAEIEGLDDVTRAWGAHLMLGTSLDSEDIGILEARTPEGVLDNGRNLVETLRKHEELSFTAEALSEVDQKHDQAQAAYDATQAGRVAVQVKQRELQAVAADVQKELVKLRTVARIVLGTSHVDFQRLRVRNARPVVEPDDDSPDADAAGSEAAASSDTTTQ